MAGRLCSKSKASDKRRRDSSGQHRLFFHQHGMIPHLERNNQTMPPMGIQ
jgi:hypothetical protein